MSREKCEGAVGGVSEANGLTAAKQFLKDRQYRRSVSLPFVQRVKKGLTFIRECAILRLS